MPDEKMFAAIRNVPIERLEEVAAELERAKLDGYDAKFPLATALEYGMRNLRDVRFSGKIRPQEQLDARYADLRGANLREAAFVDVDFTDANLTEANLWHTEFRKSRLERAIMPRIRMGTEVLDLEEQQITVTDSSMWSLTPGYQDKINVCADCENYNQMIMTGTARSFQRRGILLFQDGRPLGYMKFENEKSFLALRTVVDDTDTKLLHRGMVYSLEADVREALTTMAKPFRDANAWRRVDMEAFKGSMLSTGRAADTLRFDNQRFIARPSLYGDMSALIERIEGGEEPMIDIAHP